MPPHPQPPGPSFAGCGDGRTLFQYSLALGLSIGAALPDRLVRRPCAATPVPEPRRPPGELEPSGRTVAPRQQVKAGGQRGAG